MEVRFTSVLGPFHPCECDGPFPGALTESKQERPWLLVLEQSAFSLLADEAHNAPIIPEAQQVLLNEL